MPTYPLQGSSTQTMPASMLVASVSSAQRLDLRLELEGDGAPPRDFRNGLPDEILALPQVTGTWDIVAVNRSGQPFPADALVTLRLAHNDGRSRDPLSVLVSDAGVGGVVRCPLVRLQPRDAERVEVGRIEQSRMAQSLGEVGEFARAVARSVLQRHARRDVADLVVQVDGSASMRPWFTAGAVGPVVEAVAGIDSLTGADDGLSLAVGAGTPQQVPANDCRKALDEAVAALVHPAPHQCQPAPPGAHVVTISDGIPAGWTPAAGSLVVLSEAGAWSLLQPQDPRGIVPLVGSGPADVAQRCAAAGPDLQRLVEGIVETLLAGESA